MRGEECSLKVLESNFKNKFPMNVFELPHTSQLIPHTSYLIGFRVVPHIKFA